MCRLIIKFYISLSMNNVGVYLGMQRQAIICDAATCATVNDGLVDKVLPFSCYHVFEAFWMA